MEICLAAEVQIEQAVLFWKCVQPDGERAGDVNIRVDLRQEVTGPAHPPDIDPPIISRRMRVTREMFERFGLTAQCLCCRAIRLGIGFPAGGLTLSDISKRRESIVCSTDGGEWRIVHRWDDK